MADYLISTKFNVDTSPAVAKLNEMEIKIDEIQKKLNFTSNISTTNSSNMAEMSASSFVVGDVIGSSLSRQASKPISSALTTDGAEALGALFVNARKSAGILGDDGLLGSFSNFKGGISSLIDDLAPIATPVIAAFEKLTKASVALVGAIGVISTKMADTWQAHINDLIGINSAMFSKQLSSHATSISNISDLSKNQMNQLSDIARKFGFSLTDTFKTFQSNALMLHDFSGLDSKQAMAFTNALMRAMPVLSADTSSQSIQTDIGMLLSGSMRSAAPLWKRDMLPILAELKGEGQKNVPTDIKDFNALSAIRRFELFNEVVNRLGENAPSKLNLLSGQWNNLITNLTVDSSQTFGHLQTEVVGILSEINTYLESNDAKEKMSELASAIESMGKSVLTITNQLLFGLGLVDSTNPNTQQTIDGLGKLVVGLGEFLKVVVEIGVVISEVISTIIYDVNWLVRHALGSLMGAPIIGSLEDKIYNSINSSDSSTISLPQPKSLSAIDNLLNMKSAGADNPNNKHSKRVFKQNNHIEIQLQNDLPPDMIAQSVAEALRNAAMIPNTSRSSPNVFAMAT